MTEVASFQSSVVSNQVNLQKISVKILTDAPPTLNLDPFIAIFGRWRAEADHPAQWRDLADYAHMPRGPGIVLVGRNANFSFDLGSAAPGMLYTSKRNLDGTPEARLRSVLRTCFEMSHRLAAEPEFPRQVRLLTGSLELQLNDRLETPNTQLTDRLLRPAIESVAHDLFAAEGLDLRRQPDPGKLYGFSIHSPVSPSLDILLSRLRA